MTIPLDNLYHYIEGLFSQPVCVYLFHPHGSRNILNLQGSHEWFRFNGIVHPQVVCNDQEPLDYKFYHTLPSDLLEHLRKKNQRSATTNNIKVALPNNIHDKVILLHSEKNSVDLKLYQNDGYIDVYYWCHAIIARDWYRFAEHDKRLSQNKNSTHDFLIYCRDWSGSREYRIKFQELLHNQNLVKNSITGIMKINGDSTNLENATFKNINFSPNNNEFFDKLLNNNVLSSESADYCARDFVATHISVVLETIFDGPKIHLTEKILRPIACGHPFILAAGPGSLEYLRSYGFKTFAPWIDESYDNETNSVRRLESIVDTMDSFSRLSSTNKQRVINKLNAIADYNKKWFFSDAFANAINQELTTNINIALKQVGQTRANIFRMREKNITNKHSRSDSRNFVAQHLNNLRKLNPPGK